MRSSMKTSGACILLAATLLLPIAAQAQTPPASPKQTTQSNIHQPVGQATPDRVEQRIADLHARLQITPDQQPLWDPFAQVMRDNAQHMRQAVNDRADKLKAMNASENMLSYAQLAVQHAQDVQKLASAFQPLYGALSPDQQRTANAMFRGVGMPHKQSVQQH
jgi:periplasmic protein CpxP/Spy